VDALNEHAAALYEGHGFVRLPYSLKLKECPGQESTLTKLKEFPGL
jgi:hypothetical protein